MDLFSLLRIAEMLTKRVVFVSADPTREIQFVPAILAERQEIARTGRGSLDRVALVGEEILKL